MQNQSMSSLPPHHFYSTESSLRHPKRFFKEMFSDLWLGRGLAFTLAKRDLAAQYRQSLLGYVWAFLPVLGVTGLFTFLKLSGAMQLSNSGIPYLLFSLVGTTLWQLFVDALNSPLAQMNSGRSMLIKLNFPRESLLIAGIIKIWVNFGIRMLIVIPVVIFFLWKGEVTLNFWSPILFLGGTLAVMFFGLALGLFLVPLGVLFQDVQKALAMLISFWMFITPVVIPIPEAGFASKLMPINPVTPLLDNTRMWLLGMHAEYITSFGWVVLVSLVCFLWSWLVLRVSFPHIIARMGM
ncbi:ABC transporter permease [Kiritimatiellota bacterium B12222]|nr:ABC transporter permease [Kiritimatiellota bacterium B12222]